MGIDIFRIKETGNLIKINSEIFDLLNEFAVETQEVCINKEQLKEIIKKEKDKDNKEALKEILNEMGEDEDCDFIIG